MSTERSLCVSTNPYTEFVPRSYSRPIRASSNPDFDSAFANYKFSAFENYATVKSIFIDMSATLAT